LAAIHRILIAASSAMPKPEGNAGGVSIPQEMLVKIEGLGFWGALLLTDVAPADAAADAAALAF
jgi:hypothetical protein